MKRLFFFLLFLMNLVPVQAKTPNDSLVVAADMDELFTMDPAESFEFASNGFIYNMYQRLLAHSPADPTKFVGEIAESWEARDNGKLHVFKIKDSLKFASGHQICAHDVEFSFVRLLKLNKAPANIFGQLGWQKENIHENIQVISENEIHFYLKNNIAPSLFYNILTSANAAIVDKREILHFGDLHDFGHAWLRTHSAGSGAYQLHKWKPQECVVLQSNTFYMPNPVLHQVIVQYVKEPSTQELLLRQGDIDIAKNLALPAIKRIKTAKPFAMETGNISVLHLNQKNDYLKHPQVREAIRYLIDYQVIAKNIKPGTLAVHNSFVPSHFLFAIKGQQFVFDPKKAKALLKKAGFKNGFTVQLATVDKELAQKLKQDFAKAGITLAIRLGDSKQVLTKLRQRRHEMATAAWGSDFYDPDANASTFLRNPNNSDESTEKTLAWRNAWDIPELTQEAEAARYIQNVQKRQETYEHLQREFLKDAPMIVMFQYTKILGVGKNVQGIVMDPSIGTILYANIKKD